MTLLGVLIGVIVLIGLAVVLFKPRPEAPPENRHKISRSTTSAPKSGDAERILARMKTMAAPTLLMKAAASGFSKLGGDPELPQGMDWPIGPDGALAFLAQVDLAAARDAGGPDWLPQKGAFYVFGDERFGMRDQIRIVFSTAEACPPCEPPANQKRGWRRPERRVGFSAHPSPQPRLAGRGCAGDRPLRT